MYNIINLQLICTDCPNGMNKQNCPARKYIEKKSDLFNQTVNEDLVTMAQNYTDVPGKYERALFNIFKTCQECKAKAK